MSQSDDLSNPRVRCVNPVFELRAAPKILRSAKAGDRLSFGQRIRLGREYPLGRLGRCQFRRTTSLTLEFAESP
jgi:hypothetical protein